MKLKKIRVVSVTDDRLWYSNHIGEEFLVVNGYSGIYNKLYYEVETTRPFFKSDCEIIPSLQPLKGGITFNFK